MMQATKISHTTTKNKQKKKKKKMKIFFSKKSSKWLVFPHVFFGYKMRKLWFLFFSQNGRKKSQPGAIQLKMSGINSLSDFLNIPSAGITGRPKKREKTIFLKKIPLSILTKNCLSWPISAGPIFFCEKSFIYHSNPNLRPLVDGKSIFREKLRGLLFIDKKM